MKDNLIIELNVKLKNIFVEKYDMVTDAIIDINGYLDTLNIKYQYKYDDFCKHFISTSNEFFNNLSNQDFKTIDIYQLVQEILSMMIYKKIDEYSINKDDKSYKLLQHILIKNNI